jgi:hypothetical protein
MKRLIPHKAPFTEQQRHQRHARHQDKNDHVDNSHRRPHASDSPRPASSIFIFVAAMCRYASRARNDTLGCTHRVSRESYTFDGVAKIPVDVTRETQMEFDDFPNYLDRLREKREKTDRERDLEVKLQRIAERHREVPVAE